MRASLHHTVRGRLFRAWPLFAVCVVLPVLAWVACGAPLMWWPIAHGAAALAFAFTAALIALSLHVIGWMRSVIRFGDIRGRWSARSAGSDAVMASTLLFAITASLAGCAYLSDIYRGAAVWLDASAWNIEQPLFRAMWASPLLAVKISVWESIYGSMWFIVIGVLCLLLLCKRDAEAVEFSIAAVLVFYLAQLTALAIPMAGPALFAPESFAYTAGSISQLTQSVLASYQRGDVPQNGLLYALVAFPSVHIALLWLACAYFMLLRRALWPVAALVLALIWLSTLVLGWHYAMDGLGGIAAAIVARRIASAIMACRPLSRAAFAM